jgi:hypothetical protein
VVIVDYREDRPLISLSYKGRLVRVQMRAEYREYPNQMKVPIKTRGPSHAVVTFSWIGGDGVEQDDGTFTHHQFSYAEDFGGDSPHYLVECSHDEHLRPQVDAVHVVRRQGGRPVRSADLAKIRNLEEVIRDAWMAASRRPNAVVTDGQTSVPRRKSDPAIERAEMERTFRTLRKQSRRTVTPEHLAEVAEVYEANRAGGAPVQAVATTFGIASSTAFRRVKQAREQGLLSPRERDA